MQLIKINASDFGIEESKATQIANQFKPMLDKMIELEKEANEVFKMNPEDEKTSAMAKEVRLKYVKVRTGTAKIHSEQKSFYLSAGRYVDGWKNAQVFASSGIEERLGGIEKHFENILLEKEKAKQDERAKLLAPYLLQGATAPDYLGKMEDHLWDNYLAGSIAVHNQKIEADKKAETDRLARIEADRLERERIEKENAKLRSEKEAADKKAKIEKDKRDKEEADRKSKEVAEAKARADQKAKEDAEHEAQLKKERDQRAKVEAELKLKQEAEAKAEADIEAAKELELKKGDQDKIKDLMADIEALKSKYVFKSKQNRLLYSQVNGLLDKVSNYIKEKS